MSAILRHRHPNRFTVLPNDAIRNPALSFRAVGVLAHLLSLPDGAKVDSATLAGAHKEGRDAVRSAFSELAEHGYYRRDVIRLADGTLRTEVVVSNTPMDPREGNTAGPTGDGFSGAGPGPEYPASVGPAPVYPTSVGPTPVDQAPKEEVPNTEELIPPQPPRTAGGHGELESEAATTGGRRSRATGTNPRAEGERAEAARLEAEAARRQAELEARTDARRSADLAAEQEAERLEAEALSISAALDDATLGPVVARAAAGLSGLLAGSTVAVTRAVVAWCRTAAATHPGPFADALSAGLAAGLAAGEGSAPLDLPAAPVGTAPLRTRIAAVLKTKGAV
jgi:hypothetical protein